MRFYICLHTTRVYISVPVPVLYIYVGRSHECGVRLLLYNIYYMVVSSLCSFKCYIVEWCVEVANCRWLFSFLFCVFLFFSLLFFLLLFFFYFVAYVTSAILLPPVRKKNGPFSVSLILHSGQPRWQRIVNTRVGDIDGTTQERCWQMEKWNHVSSDFWFWPLRQP